MIKTVLIDEDEFAVKKLSDMIGECCPELDVIGKVNSAFDGIKSIVKNRPDLVLLDIDTPSTNELSLLEGIESGSFKTVFMLSRNQSVIKALELNAFDYLLKPIDPKELKRLTRSVLKQFENRPTKAATSLWNYEQMRQSNKIAIPIRNGIQFIDKKEIIYLEASSNYTTLYLKNMRPILVSKTIKSFEKVLGEPLFTRIHRGYIVNLAEVEAHLRSNGGEFQMSNGKTLSVSKSQQTKIQSLLEQISAFI